MLLFVMQAWTAASTTPDNLGAAEGVGNLPQVVSNALTAVMAHYGKFVRCIRIQLKNHKDFKKLANYGGFYGDDGFYGHGVVLHAKASAATTWGIPEDARQDCTANLAVGCTVVTHWNAADLDYISTPGSS